jgi:hypothetical protein
MSGAFYSRPIYPSHSALSAKLWFHTTDCRSKCYSEKTNGFLWGNGHFMGSVTQPLSECRVISFWRGTAVVLSEGFTRPVVLDIAGKRRLANQVCATRRVD